MNKKLGLLKEIHVEGFKSIKKMDLELKPLNIIIGANGAGKSNFIDVFKMIRKYKEGNLDGYVKSAGGANRLLHLGTKETKEIRAGIYFGKKNMRYCIDLKWDERDAFYGSAEETGHINERGVDFHLSQAFERHISSFRCFHFNDTTNSSPLKQGKLLVGDNLYLQEDGGNLASILYKLKKSEKLRGYYDRIVSAVQIIAPYFDDFVLEPDGRYLSLRWKQKNSDVLFEAFDFSDGTIRFVALATLLMTPLNMMPDTILIDEPELGLHPLALKILAEMMQAAARQGKQVIATTQSVTLINQFAPENIIVADRKDNQSVFRRLNKKDVKAWLSKYALGEIWEQNVIGGTPDEF